MSSVKCSNIQKFKKMYKETSQYEDKMSSKYWTCLFCKYWLQLRNKSIFLVKKVFYSGDYPHFINIKSAIIVYIYRYTSFSQDRLAYVFVCMIVIRSYLFFPHLFRGWTPPPEQWWTSSPRPPSTCSQTQVPIQAEHHNWGCLVVFIDYLRSILYNLSEN